MQNENTTYSTDGSKIDFVCFFSSNEFRIIWES